MTADSGCTVNSYYMIDFSSSQSNSMLIMHYFEGGEELLMDSCKGWTTLHTFMIIILMKINWFEIINLMWLILHIDVLLIIWITPNLHTLHSIKKKTRRFFIFFLFIFLDNGPHYHNTGFLLYLSEINEAFNLTLVEYNNFEAGEGKTVLDTHFAHISHKIVRWVRVGNNLQTGVQLGELVGVSLAFLYIAVF